MKKLTEIKRVSALLGSDRAVKIIVAAGFAVIVIILLSDFFSFGGADKKEAETADEIRLDAARYAEQLERQLIGILSQIQGVGRVKVMITLENLDENVYSERQSSVLTVKMPKVRGAAIVCEGGENIFIKQKVVETVSKVLGISTARVCVTY